MFQSARAPSSPLAKLSCLLCIARETPRICADCMCTYRHSLLCFAAKSSDCHSSLKQISCFDSCSSSF